MPHGPAKQESGNAPDRSIGSHVSFAVVGTARSDSGETHPIAVVIDEKAGTNVAKSSAIV